MRNLKININFGLIFSFIFFVGCNAESLTSNIEDKQTTVTYESTHVLVLGERETITPATLNIVDESSFTCMIEGAPEWVSIDSKNCVIEVTSIKVGEFGPYTVKITDGDHAIEASAGFRVELPELHTVPESTNPPAVSKYYQSTSLINNGSYFATFSATGLTFLDARNPYSPNLVAVIPFNGTSGMLQAIVSTPGYIHAVTDKGYVLSYDWTDLTAPTLVKSTRILDGGQNYDVATDEIENLFIANTDRNRFAVMNVKDPLNPTLDFSYDDLGSLGAGVAYANGYVYVTAYGGDIFTFGKNQEGAWEFVSEVTTIAGASRPFASDKYLLVAKYAGDQLDVFSLADKENPEHLETLSVDNPINIYSRSFIHDHQLYVSTNAVDRAKILVYDILKDDVFELAYTYEPKNDAGEYYSQAGIGLFRNGSFVSIVGHDKNNANLREIKTKHLSLNDQSEPRE